MITVEIDDFDDEFDAPSPSKPRVKKARPADVPPWWQNKSLQVAAAAVVVGVVVAFIYGLGGSSTVPPISGEPTNQASADPAAAAGGQIDQAKISQLMQNISKNPQDIASYQALGDLYFQAGDFQTASDWDAKVLELAPTNITGLLSHGAAQFNLGNPDAARQDWEKVISLNPKQAEAYYDMGFLYLSQNPPDMDKVRQMWNKVVQIDPTSEVAKSVKQHLQGLDSGSGGN